MIKLTRHVTVILIITVVCLTKHSQSRSSAVSSYQHLNGITVLADSVASATKGKSSLHVVDNGQISSNHNDNENASENVNVKENNKGDDNSPGIWKDLSLIYRIYQQCANENLSVCLKVRLLTGLEKVLHTTKTLRIIDGVQFMKSRGDDVAAEIHKSSNKRMLNEEDIEASLPRSNEAKEQHLNNLIFKKLVAFLRDHTLQVKFPDVRSPEHFNTNSIESRKKKDKKGGGAYIMIPLLLGGTFVPIAYGALAMLAGKALIVSKLALVLASIIGIKKLLSGGGGKEAHEVVVSSGGHSGWGRDMDLAYNGWKPAKEAGKVVGV